MRPKHWRPAIALILTLLGAGPTWAQDAPIDEELPQAQGPLIRRFLDYATAELNLTAEQRGGLERVLGETMARRGELARNGMQLQRQIRRALSTPGAHDEQFRRLSEASLALKRREVELLGWQQGRLLEVLTPRQALRFMLMQEQLAQRIEAMRRQRRR